MFSQCKLNLLPQILVCHTHCLRMPPVLLHFVADTDICLHTRARAFAIQTGTRNTQTPKQPSPNSMRTRTQPHSQGTLCTVYSSFREVSFNVAFEWKWKIMS